MSLTCALGLVVCFHFRGVAIPKEHVLRILDDCEQIYTLPPASFIQRQPTSYADVKHAAAQSWGAAMGEDIERYGIRLQWPANGFARKRLWTVTCRQFDAASNDNSNWH